MPSKGNDTSILQALRLPVVSYALTAANFCPVFPRLSILKLIFTMVFANGAAGTPCAPTSRTVPVLLIQFPDIVPKMTSNPPKSVSGVLSVLVVGAVHTSLLFGPHGVVGHTACAIVGSDNTVSKLTMKTAILTLSILSLLMGWKQRPYRRKFFFSQLPRHRIMR